MGVCHGKPVVSMLCTADSGVADICRYTVGLSTGYRLWRFPGVRPMSLQSRFTLAFDELLANLTRVAENEVVVKHCSDNQAKTCSDKADCGPLVECKQPSGDPVPAVRNSAKSDCCGRREM